MKKNIFVFTHEDRFENEIKNKWKWK